MADQKRAAQALVKIFDSDFLKAMTGQARLEIVRNLLVHGPSDVATLSSWVPQERSVVSRHLKVLEEVGLLKVSRDGARKVFSLDGKKLLTHIEQIGATARDLKGIDVAKVAKKAAAEPAKPKKAASKRKSRA